MKDYVCKCGAVNEVELQPKGTAIGLYCTKCGRWFKWVTKEEANIIKSRLNAKITADLPNELTINGVVYIKKLDK